MQTSSSSPIVSSSLRSSTSSSSHHETSCERWKDESTESSSSNANLQKNSLSNRSTTMITTTRSAETSSAVGGSIHTTTTTTNTGVLQEDCHNDDQYYCNNLYETAIVLNNIGVSLLQVGRYHPCPLPVVVEAIETFRDALLVMKSSLVQTSPTTGSSQQVALERYHVAWNRLQKYQRIFDSSMYDISTMSSLPHMTVPSSFEQQDDESNEADSSGSSSSSSSILLQDLMYRYDDIVRRTTMGTTTFSEASRGIFSSPSSSYCLVKIGTNNEVSTSMSTSDSSYSNYGRDTAIILYNYGIAYLEYYNYSTAVTSTSDCCCVGESSNVVAANNNKHLLMILKKADQLFQLSYDAYEDSMDVSSSQEGEVEESTTIDPTLDSTVETIQNLVFGMMIVSNRYQLLLSMTSSPSINSNNQASFIRPYLLQEIYRLHTEVSAYFRYLQFDQQIAKLFRRHAPAA